jgi:hypothetical protein
MDGEPLMDSEGIGEVRAALAAFPGLADVAVIEHDAGPAGRPRSVTWTAGSTSWLTLGSNQAKEWRQ